MSRPLYGRYQVPEPLHKLSVLHLHDADGAPTLKQVDWEPKCPVLDQSDLTAQGIRTSQLVPGAKDVDGLGSCTANANMSALSNVLDADAFAKFVGAPVDPVAAEKAAIIFYHRCSDQTGDPAQEWPPTDCGSSGPFLTELDVKLGLAAGDKIAASPRDIVSLLQTGGLLVGQPFLNAWEEPDADGFVDGDGTNTTVQAQINSGVAGGHETFISAVEKLTIDAAGNVDPYNTVLRVRNSWGPSWGDHGSYRIHLSTYATLAQYCDFRQLQPKTDN